MLDLRRARAGFPPMPMTGHRRAEALPDLPARRPSLYGRAVAYMGATTAACASWFIC